MKESDELDAPGPAGGRRLRLAIDAMGGDHGPLPIVEGALLASADLEGMVELVFVGREPELQAALAALPALAAQAARARVEHASEVVGMRESPALALRRKKDSSIRRAATLVASGEADGLVSAGSTGAVAAAMAVVVGLLPGVERAAIATVLPTLRAPTLLVDVGANVDCRASWLVQFAVMGRIYSEAVVGTRSPSVGLLSIGEEPGKGNELTREVYPRLEQAGVGFIGHVEGKDILAGIADVIVCDGFVGNTVLKVSESLPVIMKRILEEELRVSLRGRLGLLLARPMLRRIWRRVDWESYGGAPLLGVDGACIICHGRSGARAIRNAVRVARDTVAGRVRERIAEQLKGVS